jgi:ribonuclease J
MEIKDNLNSVSNRKIDVQGIKQEPINYKRRNLSYRNQRNRDTLSSNSTNLKIIPIGGVEEIGINCTAYEYGNDLLAVDMGLGFSDFDYYGIDAIVPDIKYFVKNRNKLRAIIITHGHLDHIGALPYHLQTLGYPDVYGTVFTIELLKAKLEDIQLFEKMKGKLHYINDYSTVLNLGSFTVRFFHINHSIPQSVGVLIQTPTAKAVHTGDFKFDNSPINESVADYARIAEFGKQGIDILLSDSTNSLKKGHPASESEVAKNLEEVIERADGRVIISSFAGLVGRLYQLLEIAKKHNRKVGVIGFSMKQTLGIAEEIGYIKIPKNLILPLERIIKMPPKQVMILTTGAQGESNAGLAKLSDEGYRGVELKKGDLVVISARTIAGNDKAVQKLIDKITEKGAKVFQSEYVDFFTSGHGYQEDQKIMMNLIKPKYFMPIHGYQYFLRAHAETAKQVGIDEKRIIIPKRGSVIEGNSQNGFRIKGKINCEPLLVSGSGVGDVGITVLREREQLANYGIVIINISVDKNKKLLRDPYVVTRGFVYVKESQKLIQEISKKASFVFNRAVAEKVSDIIEIRDEINESITKFLFTETEREPITMTIINFS